MKRLLILSSIINLLFGFLIIKKPNDIFFTTTSTNIENPIIKKINGLPKKVNDCENIVLLETSDDKTLYASSLDGIYQSTNNATFTKIFDFSDDEFSTKPNLIKITPKQEIYVATKLGLYKSVDKKTFKKIFSTTASNAILSLYISSNQTIYLGTKTGLYKSIDNETFTSIYSDWKFSKINLLAVDDNQTIYLGRSTWKNKNHRLYISQDDGKNFKPVKTIGQSNLQSITIDAQNNIYVANDFLYKSTDGGLTFNKIFDTGFNSIKFLTNKIIYGTSKTNELYISKDISEKFKKIKTLANKTFHSIAITKTKTIYLCDSDCNVYSINILNSLINLKQPDYINEKNNYFIYKNYQKIDIKDSVVARAKLDGKLLTIPTQNFPLTQEKHNLLLNVKNEYKNYLQEFSEFNDDDVELNFLIKPTINSLKDINYSTNTTDTTLITNLIAIDKNPIIQTKIKDKTGSHPATLKIDINCDLIDENNSYYIIGDVDGSNNFIAIGQKNKISSKLEIKKNGIYQFHLVDLVGNTYTSYLELGIENWKLQSINNNELSNNLLKEENKKQKAIISKKNWKKLDLILTIILPIFGILVIIVTFILWRYNEKYNPARIENKELIKEKIKLLEKTV